METGILLQSTQPIHILSRVRKFLFFVLIFIRLFTPLGDILYVPLKRELS
jgi:hypothetical protein